MMRWRAYGGTFGPGRSGHKPGKFRQLMNCKVRVGDGGNILCALAPLRLLKGV